MTASSHILTLTFSVFFMVYKARLSFLSIARLFQSQCCHLQSYHACLALVALLAVAQS